MLKRPIVAVRDSAVGAFMNPFVVPSRAAAVRAFTDEVNREGGEMQKHPEDYELYAIGEFTEEVGVVEPVVHELLVRGKDVIRRKD